MRDDVVYESSRTRVVRVSGEDGPVIRKELRGPDAAERRRHERATLERLAGLDGVPRLAGGPSGDTELLLADEGDETLATRIRTARPAGSWLLPVAERLARVLAAVHDRGVVHKDLNPANVMLVGDRPVLIDFELSTTAAEERPGFTHERRVIGTLAYLAPEQTGRTGRGVDRRSDLYSLGATLYEMATGQPPFTGTDPLELLHDHLARRPRPVTELDPAVPTALAAIIARLLEKEPDRRYQSAEGCAYDLAHAGDDDLELGTRDFPSRLSAPSRLVGRESEIAELRNAFAAAVSGRLRGVLVHGPSGVGKTALVDELRAVTTAAGGWFVSGKFDQYRQDLGSDAVGQALGALGRLLLAESEEDLVRLRADALAELGSNAGLLAHVIPDLGAVLEVEPEEPQGDRTEVQGRLFGAGLALLRVVVSPARPVVMVVDDLQWAAATPIAFMEAVLADEGLPGLLLIGAYREEEVDAAHPLSAVLARWRRLHPAPVSLRLRNLAPDDLSVLLAETLRMGVERAADLAGAIAERTGGNPFDTVELLNGLRHDHVLTVADDGWTWDDTAVRRWVGDRDLGELLTARLARLPRPARRLLTTMAALGGETGTGLLRVALAAGEQELESRLAPALEDGLIVLSGDGDVRFRHDRVQQAAYALLTPRARRLVHLVLAERLASGYPEVAAQQYLPAAALVHDPVRRRRLAELFQTTASGLRVINAMAAEQYLDTAVGLCGAGDDDLLDRLLVDHHRVLCEVGRPGDADVVYASLGARLGPVDLAPAAGVQIAGLTVRARPAEAIAAGMALLGRLGVAVPERDDLPAEIEAGLDRLREWAGTVRAEDDLARAETGDRRTRAAGQILMRMMSPAFFTDHAVLVWLVTAAQRLWVADGPSAPLIVALGHAGAATILARQDYRTGYRIVRHVELIGDARGWPVETAVARFLASVSTAHWFEPVENSIERGKRAHESLVHGGDLAFACFTFHATVPAQLDCAPTLTDFHAELTAAIAFTNGVGNEQNATIMAAFEDFHRAMTGVRGDRGPDLDGMAGAYRHALDGLAAVIGGDVGALTEQARALTAKLPYIEGNYFTTTAQLVRALALLAERRIDELDDVRDWLSARAAGAPANFRHLVLFLDAERAWATGDPGAGAAFDAALREVAGHRRPWHHALIAERAAHYYLSQGLEYLGYRLLRDAHERWLAWGATAKVAAQEAQFPFLHRSPAPPTAPMLGASTSFASEAVDLMAVLQASQALSSETSLPKLRRRVIDILTALTGATTVHLLTRADGDGEWLDPDGAGPVPRSIVRYAERTREPLVVDNAADDPRFAHDPYFEGLDLCAVLVVTIRSHGTARTMLLLENRLWRGTFTGDRLDAVVLIAGQLAVSLENAGLYASLERKVAERTEQLRVANAQLEILSGTDALTGLANRRRLDDELADAWRGHLDAGEPLAVAMVDIDHFKPYNDLLGHAAGDGCLRLVAQAVARVVREMDLVARYGGEEFTVILPGADQDEAEVVAERIRRAVVDLNRPHPAANGAIVTVSIGVSSEIPSAGRDAAQLVADADAALYAAKEGGRNRVRLAAPARPRR